MAASSISPALPTTPEYANSITGSGDAVWILTSAFIIFTMISGFGLVESGKFYWKSNRDCLSALRRRFTAPSAGADLGLSHISSRYIKNAIGLYLPRKKNSRDSCSFDAFEVECPLAAIRFCPCGNSWI